MHKLLLALASLLLVAAPNLQAQDRSSAPVPVAYINLNFGGGAKPMSRYGLQLARVQLSRAQHDGTGGVSLFSAVPYADLKFNGSELDSFKLNGVNTLEKVVTYNADGTTSTQSGINWKYVGWGALGLGVVWWTCEERDWDLCGDKSDDPPPAMSGMVEDTPPM